MKKKVSREGSEEKKGFVWISLRISFYLMLLLFVLSFFINFAFVNILFLILLIFAIIVSIIHLCIHKKRAYAIVILVISFLLLLFYLIGIVSQTRAG